MRWAAIGAAALAFLAISGLVARVLSAGAAARGEVTDAIERRAGGGDVEFLRVDGVRGFRLGGGTDVARVAWRVGDRLPVVQCVRVRRTGDPFAGYDATVQSVSAPIDREADCPGTGHRAARPATVRS